MTFDKVNDGINVASLRAFEGSAQCSSPAMCGHPGTRLSVMRSRKLTEVPLDRSVRTPSWWHVVWIYERFDRLV